MIGIPRVIFAPLVNLRAEAGTVLGHRAGEALIGGDLATFIPEEILSAPRDFEGPQRVAVQAEAIGPWQNVL